MKFELVLILEKLRDLYLIPRGPNRFQAYIDLATGGATASKDIPYPPLITVNPMAKEHALEFVESLILLESEKVAQTVLEEANVRLESVEYPNAIKVGLSVLDDLKGGWTNRTFNDAARFKVGESLEKTGWLCVPVWTSEIPNLSELRAVVLEAACRAAFALEHGDPKSLREMMAQEGLVATFANRSLGFGNFEFDREELEYSRAVIAPHLDSTHQPTVIACLYGDEAAKELGYPPLGLSKNAGFQIALANALEVRV
jgi:uncharacterized protein YjaZ